MRIEQTLLETFSNLPMIIESYFKNIPEENFDVKRNKDTWTIREHLYHIVEVQKLLYKRMLEIKEKETPEAVPYFPEERPDRDKFYKSTDNAFDKYKNYRTMQIDLINTYSDKDLKKEVKHPEYKIYNISEIVHHMIFHEYWHMYRIEEIWLTKDEYFK